MEEQQQQIVIRHHYCGTPKYQPSRLSQLPSTSIEATTHKSTTNQTLFKPVHLRASHDIFRKEMSGQTLLPSSPPPLPLRTPCPPRNAKQLPRHCQATLSLRTLTVSVATHLISPLSPIGRDVRQMETVGTDTGTGAARDGCQLLHPQRHRRNALLLFRPVPTEVPSAACFLSRPFGFAFPSTNSNHIQPCKLLVLPLCVLHQFSSESQSLNEYLQLS